MTINVLGASSKYIYSPYEYVSDNDGLTDKDEIGDEKLLSKGLYGTRKYELDVSDNIVTNYSDIVENLKNNGDKPTKYLKTKITIMNLYIKHIWI